MECIANETKIYKGYGFFDAIAVKRIFMNSVSGNREWGEIVAKSVDVCVIESEYVGVFFCGVSGRSKPKIFLGNVEDARRNKIKDVCLSRSGNVLKIALKVGWLNS